MEIIEKENKPKIPTGNEVKEIFNGVYALNKKFSEYDLFNVLVNLTPSVDFDTFFLIEKDCFNYFNKWKNVYKDEDWFELNKEHKVIRAKYNCELCDSLIKEILNILEKQYLDKK